MIPPAKFTRNFFDTNIDFLNYGSFLFLLAKICGTRAQNVRGAIVKLNFPGWHRKKQQQNSKIHKIFLGKLVCEFGRYSQSCKKQYNCSFLLLFFTRQTVPLG